MLIFLDSNIICSNYFMKGPSFEVAQRVGTIVLGQIVVDEVCNKYKESLVEQVTKAKNAIQDLNKLLPESPVPWEETNVADKCSKYKDFLEMFIIESGMTVAEDYPEAKYEDIVRRALQRKKPFKADGSTGYGDYLVWLTCLETARSYANEEIHFITSNTRDFADTNDKEKIHPDLVSDLAEWKIPDTRFFYWNSLKSFIDKYAKPRFDIIEAREMLVAEIEKNEAGFLTLVQEFVNCKVIGCSLTGYDVFVPGDNVILKEIESDVGPRIEEVSELDDNSLLLGITIDSIGVVTSTLSISNVKEITGKNKDDFKDGNAKFITYMNVYSNPALRLDVTDTVKVLPGERQNCVQYGDVLFTGSSETPDECGMSSVLTQRTDEKLYLNSFCMGYRLNNPNLFEPDFLKHLFRSTELRRQISRTANGVTRFNVSKEKMRKVKETLNKSTNFAMKGSNGIF